MKASPASQNKDRKEGWGLTEFMKQEGNHCPGADWLR